MNSSILIGSVLILTGFALLYINICSFNEERKRILKLDFYKFLDKDQHDKFDNIYKRRLLLMKTEIIFSLLMSVFGILVILFF